jgi:nucleotide-binding universal stress UspA family protein
VNRKNTEVVQRLLEKHREQMTTAGIAENDLRLKTQPRMLGVAKDILEFSYAGHYDAVILGRRGLSGLEDVFIGSVSANIVNNSKDIPIWLVDEHGPSKEIMVAVDGSEDSFKAVLDEFRQGNFGTVVVGRRGMNKKYFTGSVSRYLMNHFSSSALWVVP